ncbi:unextended protein isoform X1 [Rhopalosiphum padi]|uniref:unextended protein isoform X1 n=1 Tax=Rhopalosiphum padi TaxID=40932 RepID=UPI00298E0406|nr:unextended protein isoform X1 [Rhopalosiphum padi]
MAACSPKRTLAFIVLLVLCEGLVASASYGGSFVSLVEVVNHTKFTQDETNDLYVNLTVGMFGQGLNENIKIRPTSRVALRGSECYKNHPMKNIDSENHIFKQLWTNGTYLLMSITFKFDRDLTTRNVYLCTYEPRKPPNGLASSLWSVFSGSGDDSDGRWVNQGDSVAIRSDEMAQSTENSLDSSPSRQRRQQGSTLKNVTPLGTAYISPVNFYGLRVEYSDAAIDYDDRGVPQLLVQRNASFRLFGSDWTEKTIFVLTEKVGDKGGPCEFPVGEVQEITLLPNEPNTAKINIILPQASKAGTIFYFCSKESDKTGAIWTHMGSEYYKKMGVYEKMLPFWLQVAIILTCLSFSSLFSGLNLGLMSLNRMDLKIICNTGTEAERKYAKAILPVRIHGNYLLCSILLGNVMVNSIFTILLDDLTSGLVAVITSTLAIVIFGEITPQAVCSRHGLAIGAKTIYVTKTVMVLTTPLSWPISKALDWALGEEIGSTYNRERLKELVKMTGDEYNDLEKDEVNIISGALELHRKKVGDVMTKLEDVYMLSYDTILDFETVSEIMKSGYSRIPVYEGNRQNIVTMLYIKDLALVDPDDNTLLKTLCQFYQNPCYFVFEDTTLDVLFKQFKEGIKGHMAFVHRVNNEGEGDPFYETVGIITLEDVIEELIQAEIMDETDVYTDNRSKQRRQQRSLRAQDFTAFAERSENQRIHISPQLTLATFQFLSSSVEAFKTDVVSETILMRLLKQDVIFHIKMKDKERFKSDPASIIYQQGKPVDYFVLILEGRVEVTVGRENLVFESGPFTYFGSQALHQNIGIGESPPSGANPTMANSTVNNMGSIQSVNIDAMLRYTFVPDYSVRAVTEVMYLRVKRSFYMAAKRATLMERSKKMSNAGEFDEEVDKLFHTYGDEDRKSIQGSPDVTRNASQTTVQPSTISANAASLNNGEPIQPVAVAFSRTPQGNSDASAEEKITLLGTNTLSAATKSDATDPSS